MLEYFTYKKVKKHQAEKEKAAHAHPQTQVARPVLNEEDANFLERVVSAEGPAPALPDRPEGWVPGVGMEAGDSTGNQAQMVVHDGNAPQQTPTAHKDLKGKGKEHAKPAAHSTDKKANRFSFLARNFTKKNKAGVHPEPVVPATEATKEEDDINRVLEDLNLAAVNNRAFSLSKESQQLVQQFTVILKDLINGVPTAYDDLTHLLDDKQGTLSKSYESLPSFLKKLITQLPDKIKGNLAPELLAVASEAVALGGKGGAAPTSFSGAAKAFLTPTSLKDLVTKPGAVVGLLKAIMNALKLRWPAFMGTNVLLSLGLFVLLFVFWYCHKRGREVRLEREAKVDSEGRIIELADDPMIESSSGARPSNLPRTQTEPSPNDYNHSSNHGPNDQTLRPERERERDNHTSSSRNRSSEQRRQDRNEEYAMAGGRSSHERR